ncbi:MAG: alanine--tRNA ligase, partial [Nitrososphaeria archaeon]|nr:alanine--tRNA ligase [Nitrososphaeria archaeon]NIN53451.1 alanine--tRNA ligase [Nitrososphaeria archaeon]NIQ33969.1 alanine--tRNA ligase [Nitrososphaeria archaeon]
MEFQISEKDFDIAFMRERGYVRRRCKTCGAHFWTVDSKADFCGDAPCVEYAFIDNPPTKRRYSLPEMRNAFLGFFERYGHEIVDPYPVVARWRDDLLVTIASIVDFQPYVTDGIIDPPANPLVVSQPCLRFEDIEHTGYTAGRHFTIFEMGGHHAFNFPGKPEIYWKDRTVELHHLFATEDLGISEEQITYKEHFWSGGGNAGPDLEGSILGLEVSTLVFMQFKVSGEQLIPSPVKTVDTGYGIERWAWLSQGSGSAFETIYGKVMEQLLDWAGVHIERQILRQNAAVSASYRLDAPESSNAARAKAAERLGMSAADLSESMRPYEEFSTVLDHSKALIFLLSEGAVPSNVREGYLSRLLFRRLYRILMKYGVEQRLEDLIQIQIDYWGRDYPKLREMREEVFNMIEVEKKKYSETLRKGRSLVKRMIKPSKPRELGVAAIDVDALIELYDSHGLHPEIVKKVAREGDIEVVIPYNFFSLVAKRHEAKQEAREEEIGVGIETPPISLEKNFETEALYYVDPYIRDFEADVLYSEGPHIILDRTAFYPEGGGQRGDTGRLEFEGGIV